MNQSSRSSNCKDPHDSDEEDRSWVEEMMLRVEHLHDRLNGLNSSLEELGGPLSFVAGKLIYEKELPPPIRRPLPLELHEVQRLIQLALGVINFTDQHGLRDSESAVKLREMAFAILSNIVTMNKDCDQTKLVFNSIIPRVRVSPDDECYCKDLVAGSARYLSEFKFEHVLTKDEAFSLIEELIHLTGKAFIKFDPHSHPHESVELLEDYRYCDPTRDSLRFYRMMIRLLFKLQRYAGLGRYREYVYSKVQATENGRLTADLLAAINALAIEQRPASWKDDCSDPKFREFVNWMLQLMDSSEGLIRNHLLFLVYHFMFLDDRDKYALRMFAPEEFCIEVAQRLLEDFIARDDLVFDCIVMDYIDECDHFRFKIFNKLSKQQRSSVEEKLKRLDCDPDFLQKAVKRQVGSKGYRPNESLLKCSIEDLCRPWTKDMMTEVEGMRNRLENANLLLEELEDPLKSVAETLRLKKFRLYSSNEKPLPMDLHGVQIIIELALEVIDRTDHDEIRDSESAASLRDSAFTILSMITMNMDRNQTELVFKSIISRVRVGPDDRCYCKDLVAGSATYLSQTEFKLVLTKDEAVALIDELIPLTGKAFLKLDPNSQPHGTVELLGGWRCPDLAWESSRFYRMMICLLFKLQQYVGLERYRELVYSKLRCASSDKLSPDLLAAINVLAIELRPDLWEGDREDPKFKEFVDWMLQLTSKSDGLIRSHLLYIIYHYMFLDDTQYGVVRRYASEEFCVEVGLGLLEDFLVRDDTVSDCIVMDYIDRCNCHRLEIFERLSEEKKGLVKEKLKRLDSDPNFVEKLFKRTSIFVGYSPDKLLSKRLIEDLEIAPRARVYD